MTNVQRRVFLKNTLAAGAVAAAAGTGILLRPARVAAAEWPKAAFTSKSVVEALKNLYGTSQTSGSNAINIKTPLQAENGAVVPISVAVDLPNVETISILVEKNPQPLAATVRFSGQAETFFKARVKMGQTSDVRVAVKANGKIYSAKQNVKVTVGGCGG